MKTSFRSLALAASLASVTALGGNLALAADSAPAPKQQAGAQRSDCRGEHRHHGKQFLNRLAVKLGLSEQQKAQAKAVLEGSRAQSKPLMANLKHERGELRNLIHSGTADEAAIRAQSAKVAAVQADLAVQRAATAKKLMALLTPEQQTKLKELQAHWKEHKGEHRGKGMKRGE